MMVTLPLYLLIQVMPPPFGQVIAIATLGIGSGAIAYSMPIDCGCGVPSSPPGPR